jgi:hypothetical protein
MEEGKCAMGKHPGNTTKDEDEQQRGTPETQHDDREDTERREQGAGGLSKAAFEEVIEKAVEGIHG